MKTTCQILLMLPAALLVTSCKDENPFSTRSSATPHSSSSSTPSPPRKPSSTSYKVTVYDEKMTGIYLKEGDEVSIQANGTMHLRKGAILGTWSCGPDGHGENLKSWGFSERLSFGSLIYKYGGNSWDEAGAHCEFVADESGYLELMVNDSRMSDNSGSFNVRVRVTR